MAARPVATAAALALLAALLAGTAGRPGPDPLTPGPLSAARTLAVAAPAALRAALPLDFVANRGQWDSPARFAARNGPVTALFEDDAIVLRRGAGPAETVRLTFEGSEGATLVGEDRRSGRYNFLVGNDPMQWRTDVPAYASVLYRDLYEGVDVRVRQSAAALEYDLLLAPGADLDRIAVRTDGVSAMRPAADGSLLLETASGSLRQGPPTTWEVLPTGEHRPLASTVEVLGPDRFGFRVPGRDRSLPLVVDPGLEWATYLGGHGDETVSGLAMTSGGSGDIVLAGQTWSPDFPRTSGNLVPVGATPYVLRLDSTGTSLVYATFFGGTFNHSLQDVAVNAAGQPVVVGDTNSLDFPTTPGAYDRTPGDGMRGDYDAYVLKLTAAGNGVVFGTYLGGSPSSANADQAWAVAYDPAGAVVVAGQTTSADFPTTAGAYDRALDVFDDGSGIVAKQDVFVSRLDLTGSQLTYSTFVGGQGYDYVYGMVVDDRGAITLTGKTSQPQSFDTDGNEVPLGVPMATTADAFDRTYNGAADAYLVRLEPNGGGAADLRYASFLGGRQYTEAGTGVALDPADPELVTVAGWTRSGDFPTTAGALQRTHFAPVDASMAFVTRFRLPATGAGSLLWSTLYGAPGNQAAEGVVVDGAGSPIIAGPTAAQDPPTTPRAYDRIPDRADAFVARLSGDGARLEYATLLGGTMGDGASEIGYAGGTSVVVPGLTNSVDFPVTAGAFDTVYGADGEPSGGSSAGSTADDVFVARVDLRPPASSDTTAPGAPTLLGPAVGAAYTAHAYVTLDWSDVADPSGVQAYHVQVSPNETFTNTGTFRWHESWVPTSVDVVSRSVSDTGTFSWRVQVLDGAGNLGPWSAVRTFTVSSPAPPPAPTLVSPPNNGRFGPGSITFAWDHAAGAKFYELQVDTSSTFGNANKTWVRGITGTRHTLSFSTERKYYWRVRGTNDSMDYGAWSTVRNFEIKSGSPAAPTPPPETPPPAASGPAFTLTPGQQSLNGGTSGELTVTLPAAAPAGGAVVPLASQRPDRVSVPPSVTVAAGATSASFPVTARSTNLLAGNVVVSGEHGGQTQGALVTVFPDNPANELHALTVSAGSVTGGGSLQGTVSLIPGWQAGPGGELVTLGSTNPALLSVPDRVTIPQGANSATFPITTSATAEAAQVTVHAARSRTFSRTVTVFPPGSLSSVSVSPTSVAGGATVQGTVTLTGPAPAGNASVAVTSSDPAVATVPASVTVPAGSQSATFTVTTKPVSATAAVTVTAAVGDVTKSATLTVTAPTGPLPAPTLMFPTNGARVSLPVSFMWSAVSGAASYTLQVDDSSTIASPFVLQQTVTGTNQFQASSLPRKKLWWRVRAHDGAGNPGTWSSVWRLEVR